MNSRKEVIDMIATEAVEEYETIETEISDATISERLLGIRDQMRDLLNDQDAAWLRLASERLVNSSTRIERLKTEVMSHTGCDESEFDWRFWGRARTVLNHVEDRLAELEIQTSKYMPEGVVLCDAGPNVELVRRYAYIDFRKAEDNLNALPVLNASKAVVDRWMGSGRWETLGAFMQREVVEVVSRSVRLHIDKMTLESFGVSPAGELTRPFI